MTSFNEFKNAAITFLGNLALWAIALELAIHSSRRLIRLLTSCVRRLGRQLHGLGADTVELLAAVRDAVVPGVVQAFFRGLFGRAANVKAADPAAVPPAVVLPAAVPSSLSGSGSP